MLETPQNGNAPLYAKIHILYLQWRDASAASNDAAARQIVEKILRALGVSINVKARTWKGLYPVADYDSLFQAGQLAVAPALKCYKPERTNARILTYLAAAINGAMKEEATDAAERDRRERIASAGVTESRLSQSSCCAGADDPIENAALRVVQDQYLDQLSLEQRIVLKKRFIENLTYEKIAQLVDTSERSVRRIEAAAREKLRELIGSPDNL